MEEVPEPVEERNKLDKFSGRGMANYSTSREFSGMKKSCITRVRKNDGRFLETEQCNCRSYAAAKRRLPLVYCYVLHTLHKVVMTQWWLAQKIPMSLGYVWPLSVPLMPVCSRNAIIRHAQS